MKLLTAACGRFALIVSAAVGVASFVNAEHHKSYWNGTIQRVQTVDFNILTHTLPTKLSSALVQGNGEELQRTLNSNYGYFGLVVTSCKELLPECSNEKITFATNSDFGWRQHIDEKGIGYLREINAPYDILRNPPPLLTESEFDSSRDLDRNATGATNTGDIIGRVYYVRGFPPSFRESYSSWLAGLPGNLFKDSQAYRYYGLTLALFLAGGLSIWLILEALMAQRRAQKKQLEGVQVNKYNLRQSIRWRDQRIDCLTNQVRLLTQHNQEAEELKSQLDSELKFAHCESSEKSQRIDRLLEQNRVIQKNCDESQDQFHCLQQTFESQSLELENSRAQCEALESERLKLEEALLNSNRDRDTALSIRTQAERQLQGIKEDLQRNVWVYQRDIEGLRTNLEVKQNQLDECEQEYSESQAQVRLLQQALESQSLDLGNSRAQYEVSEAERIKLEEALLNIIRDRGTGLDLRTQAEYQLQSVNEDLQRVKEKLWICQQNNEGLRSHLEARRDQHGEGTIIFESTERDFYDRERLDLLLAIVSIFRGYVTDDSRRQHLLSDIIDSNRPGGEGPRIEQELRDLFRDYTGMTDKIRYSLERLGFAVSNGGSHHKIIFKGDKRYIFSLSSTPSKESADKIVSDIRKKLL